MAVEPQKFPEVHYPPRGEDVKLLEVAQVVSCTSCNYSIQIPFPHWWNLNNGCPQCEEIVTVRDIPGEVFKP